MLINFSSYNKYLKYKKVLSTMSSTCLVLINMKLYSKKDLEKYLRVLMVDCHETT
jgi:hypothetical protein